MQERPLHVHCFTAQLKELKLLITLIGTINVPRLGLLLIKNTAYIFASIRLGCGSAAYVTFSANLISLNVLPPWEPLLNKQAHLQCVDSHPPTTNITRAPSYKSPAKECTE